ncbi:hypothetical protein [Pseudoxanthomonas sp. CF125]|uniref:hypothetical protein n=1 Tax=Pseudoxanthomonas sp. CF125 TaxID=1855303 RepID=UPI00088F47E7|nr:hypothetical protein [Pseudoxanthomonas sp. CF125]SDR21969.1 hypothetical protein SAMN05216569_3646 [Pseudoxanthomonas sp. CF125]
MIAVAAILVLIVGPLLLASAGWFRTRTEPVTPVVAWDTRLTLLSVLLYTLAFNLVFFVQELFLVLPKAFTPGLQPTLFHNNHRWEGEHALAGLFQGTGALATFMLGLGCLFLLRRGVGRATPPRLFLIWLAYCGVFMALPQVVVGALSSGSDVGMAMDYFWLSANAKNIAALLALAAIPLFARQFSRHLLGLASQPAQLASAGACSRFIFQTATVPALVAIVLILPFRVPREWIEVLFLPVIVAGVGMFWIQSGAWRLRTVKATGLPVAIPLAYPLGAAIVLLLVFQLLLRPGIPFF